MAPEQEKQPSEVSPAAPGVPTELPHRPGVTPGSVDVTGIVPEGIRIDPDITEGHPGYEESGDSGIIPFERLAGGGTEAPSRGD